MALAIGTGYLINLIYYVSIGTLKMVVQIPVPSLMALTSLMGINVKTRPKVYFKQEIQINIRRR